MSEAMTDTVRVDLGARSYDVRVGRGLLARAGAEIAPFLKRPRVTVVTVQYCDFRKRLPGVAQLGNPRQHKRRLQAGIGHMNHRRSHR